MTTPIGQLELALAGHDRFVRRSNPFRTQKDIDDEQMMDRMEATADREGAARSLIAWAQAMQKAQEAGIGGVISEDESLGCR